MEETASEKIRGESVKIRGVRFCISEARKLACTAKHWRGSESEAMCGCLLTASRLVVDSCFGFS